MGPSSVIVLVISSWLACVSWAQSVGNLTVLPSSGGVILPMRIAGTLVIDLQARDFSTTTNLWDNRATAGSVSINNGDFGVTTVGSVAISPPTKGVLGAVESVIFAPGANKALTTFSTPTGPAGSAHFARMWGNQPFTLEAIIQPMDFPSGATGMVGQESPFFQWGSRSAAACRSGFLSLGSHPIWGAGGYVTRC